MANFNLNSIAGGLSAIEVLLPFVLGMVGIIRKHIQLGSDSIPMSEITGAWQSALDRVDSKGRAWLVEHGMEVPPPKPDAVEEE